MLFCSLILFNLGRLAAICDFVIFFDRVSLKSVSSSLSTASSIVMLHDKPNISDIKSSSESSSEGFLEYSSLDGCKVHYKCFIVVSHSALSTTI